MAMVFKVEHGGVTFERCRYDPRKFMGLGGFGEVLPYHDNKIYLDYNKKDKWGLPLFLKSAEKGYGVMSMSLGLAIHEMVFLVEYDR